MGYVSLPEGRYSSSRFRNGQFTIIFSYIFDRFFLGDFRSPEIPGVVDFTLLRSVAWSEFWK